MPLPLPDGGTFSSETDLRWAASVKQGGINWYEFAACTAGAGAAAMITVLVLDDSTGIGALDDGLIPLLVGFISENAEILSCVFPELAVAGCTGG